MVKGTLLQELIAALKPISHYVSMRQKAPLRGLSDSVHAIHTGSAYEAEITMADLERIADLVKKIEATASETES